MNTALTTLATISVALLVGCNKTQKATMASDSVPDVMTEMDVEVYVEGDAMKITLNGEEVDGLPDNLMEHVMTKIGSDGDEHPMQQMHVLRIMGGDEHGDVHEMHKRYKEHMRSGLEKPHDDILAKRKTVTMEMKNSGRNPENTEQMREIMMQLHGKQGGPPEGMREHMMHMMGSHGDRHGKGHFENPHGEWRRHHEERDIPEEVQFMQELGILGEVAGRLEDSESVALMGIHMIRDELEGEVRMESLEKIIEEAGPIARNAALIVAIQTMLEEGNDEVAADYMVELVISN